MNLKPVKTKADYKIALKSRVSEILIRKRKLIVEMFLERGQIFFNPILSPSKGWEKAFKVTKETFFV